MMMDAAAVETADLKATIPAETTKLLANGKEYTIHRPTSSEWIGLNGRGPDGPRKPRFSNVPLDCRLPVL